jgi:carboxyl-terminal processing protease
MGMKKLVLDLRSNGGGYMEQAVKLADEFIGGEKTLVYSKGRVPVFDEYDVSRSGDAYEKLPLVVLVDGGSASASEILSGALQDLDRAPLVGTTTFGKGLVQRQFALGDGSAVRLTIAKYYTPSGRSIQRPYDGAKYTEGIKDFDLEEEDNFTHSAETIAGDSTRPKFTTPTGRTIYGGGGITPDFIIKPDTLTMTSLRLLSGSVLWDYVSEYIAESATDLKNRYTEESFPKSFALPSNAFVRIKVKADERKVKIDEKEFECDEAKLNVMLRGEIGRQLFGNNVKAAVLIKSDKQFQKAYGLFGEAEKMAVMFK